MPIEDDAPDEADGVGTAARSGELMMVLPAAAVELPEARGRARAWLREWTWPVDDADDVVLAVSEAIANVVDHAYPPDAPGPALVHGWVSVDAQTGWRRVIVAVTDHGRWAAHQPPMPGVTFRGHGLVVMSGCMAEVHIQRSSAGTTVILISASVPPAPGSAASPPVSDRAPTATDVDRSA